MKASLIKEEKRRVPLLHSVLASLISCRCGSHPIFIPALHHKSSKFLFNCVCSEVEYFFNFFLDKKPVKRNVYVKWRTTKMCLRWQDIPARPVGRALIVQREQMPVKIFLLKISPSTTFLCFAITSSFNSQILLSEWFENKPYLQF